ncbi:hypothetical protein NLI96_g9860 [Meripilus lineatus]|uniref:C2H2-type domain-containing protein n=1 Tax=Meripilus lineatus TaxID=2056292 RepID=A0AAD5UUP6_9APHY|nr:hypothetical protein NLI96_g9860 [Physisporinus lineatus]
MDLNPTSQAPLVPTFPLPGLHEDLNFRLDELEPWRSFEPYATGSEPSIPYSGELEDQQQAWASEALTARIQAMEKERLETEELEKEIAGFVSWDLFESEEAQDGVAEGLSQSSTPPSLFDEGSTTGLGTSTESISSSSTSSPSPSLVPTRLPPQMLPYYPQYVLHSYFGNVQHTYPISYVGQGMMPPPFIPPPITTAATFNQFTATARAGSRTRCYTPSSVSGSSEFVQGSSSDGPRSVYSSTSSTKRKRGSDNDDDDDEDDEPRPCEKKPKKQPPKQAQPKGQKKGTNEPPKARTFGFRCPHHKCSNSTHLWRQSKDRDRHIDIHFNPRFECLGCGKRYTRPESVQRHSVHPEAEAKCTAACKDKKYSDFQIDDPHWHKAEAWENMYFPARDDPLYERVAALLGYRG